MAGSTEAIVKELLDFARDIRERNKIIPYVAFVVKEGQVISRGYNFLRESQDVTMFSEVAAIRWTQESLDTGDLSGYTLFNLFEPTLLGFDVALWAGIRDFVWCINAKTMPNQYSSIPYRIEDYERHNPGEITILAGVNEKEAMKIVAEAQQRLYWPRETYT